MIFPVFILSPSLLFTTELFAKERNQEREIVLLAIGAADKSVMDWLKNDLSTVFNREITGGEGMLQPDYAFPRPSDLRIEGLTFHKFNY